MKNSAAIDPLPTCSLKGPDDDDPPITFAAMALLLAAAFLWPNLDELESNAQEPATAQPPQNAASPDVAAFWTIERIISAL